MKCPHCPVASGACHGESTPRMCELMDPSRPDHDPRYGPLLVEMAGRAAYPPFVRQAGNLAGSFWSWAVSGFSMATEEEQARRLTICRGCEHFDAAAVRCCVCGCYLAAKVAMRAEKCPINLW